MAELTHSIEIGGRRLTVWLPPSYPHSERRYPAVYIHDGGQLMLSCCNYVQRQFREGGLDELIMVGIGTACRTDDYSPWPAEALKEGRPSFGGHGPAYIDEIADRIKPYVDAHYRTAPEPEHTGMIGGSLGGLVTALAAYLRPDAFRRFGLLSPSFWFEGFRTFAEQTPLPSRDTRLYISAGSLEGVYKDGIQKHALSSIVDTVQQWRRQGLHSERLKLHVEEDATHDLVFMARQFPEALRELYPDAVLPAEPFQTVGGEGCCREAGPVPHRPAEPFQAGDGDCRRFRDADSAPRHPRNQHHLRYSVPGTEVFDYSSGITGRSYRISVYTPSMPPSGDGYPVLYTVDMNAYFGSLAEAMTLQTRHPLGLRPAVIVGIGYPSDEPFVTNRRFLDLTIPADPEGLRPDGTPWPANGEADSFQDFIESELMPLIARRFPAGSGRRSLFGHSLGGFFCLYTLMTRPHLFQTYIAGSPSIWWKDHVLYNLLADWKCEDSSSGNNMNNLAEIRSAGCEAAGEAAGGVISEAVGEAQRQARKRTGNRPEYSAPSVLIAIGSQEKGIMLQDAQRMYEELKTLEYRRLGRVSYHLFEDEGHVSVLHPLISRMLRFISDESQTKS
ncbi:alpha/beta hydrolase [Paenibacillus sp. HN-1]|uniref:alpha/beta hydrolase n=1 Tax=Paenibacillus TaxID=44249 RepID=UPI001CA8AE82|nr:MULTISPECIES: alpha/beta hydrolase-fold protein [Paenibacillus]MBY9078396.1 alpha/beta hydrolase [Paenibacillus sp. CGMCC 1.18879]MBY9087889.1 alpha/beta hydrolase [Paenibacillus sinensis]